MIATRPFDDRLGIRFDLVIFDCDGVLLDSEIISARMLIAELAKFGLHIDLDYVSRHFLGRSYPTVMATIRSEFCLDLPPTFEETYRATLLAAFEKELRVMPHVRSAIDDLALPYCVATSSSPSRVALSLRVAGLGDLIGPRLFTASMVKKGKPAPDLFLHAAHVCGADPARCLVIEDSLTGIRAALAGGMEVWRFTGGSHMGAELPPELDDARPHRHFNSFASFLSLHPDFQRQI